MAVHCPHCRLRRAVGPFVVMVDLPPDPPILYAPTLDYYVVTETRISKPYSAIR
jgi:hypothetical protein